MNTVAFILPSLAGGGAERVMLTLAAGIDRTRYRVSLILLSDEGPLAQLVADDIAVTVLGKPRLRAALPALRRTLRRMRPDTAVSTMAYLNMAVLGVRPRGTRVVVREANSPRVTVGQGLKAAVYRFGYRRLYRRAHRVIAPSKLIRSELSALGVADDRIRVLYNPVDVAVLRARAAQPRRAQGGGRRFVAAGRLTEQKGFDRLIDMAGGLDPQDRIDIFGDGPLRGSLEAGTKAAGLSGIVRLQPFTDALPSWIAGADALLLPSRWEGLPNVALEALALGAPVIATPEAGGIGEIAALAPSGSVTLAPEGPKFIAALQASALNADGVLRTSRLPDAFTVSKAVAGFEAILDS
jgi:glycosyltransferase involved in cell wall biosynthesis